MSILADITHLFVPEVPQCGSASKCYCITCTRRRATTFKLFAAWRQVARASHPKNPVSMKLNYFTSHYACYFKEYNALVGIVQDAANCNGSYAAAITVEICAYATEISCRIVFMEYLSCSVPRPIWLADSEVLTYWFDPEADFWNGNGWRWNYLRRQSLFRIFHLSMQEALFEHNQDAFNKLKNSVPAKENGKFKNHFYIIRPSHVIIPDSGKEINFTIWPQYWLHYEMAFGL